MSFQDFCNNVQAVDQQIVKTNNTFVINFSKPGGSSFNVDPSDLIVFMNFLSANHAQCKEAIENDPRHLVDVYTKYEEKPYRALYRLPEGDERLNTIKSLGGSQTKELTKLISKLICFLAGIEYCKVEDNTHFDKESVDLALRNIPEDLTALASSSLAYAIPFPMKEKFKGWMRSKSLSERTITSYADASIKFTDRLIYGNELNNRSIYQISDPVAIENIIATLQGNEVWQREKSVGHGMHEAGMKKYMEFLRDYIVTYPLPKPFILLAGISGTGKTRFVREQAQDDKSNYELVAVRPDWHEPSDLLGYVSRIGGNGAHYVVTDVLKFIVKAWKAAIDPAQAGELKPLGEIAPFWLCLDEMNLAPVEQYFADYLSVLETRKWTEGKYTCDPILKLGALSEQLDIAGMEKLRKELGVENGNAENDALWDFFNSKNGIPLPPNLIVAGTVNMDETTHGFSRKVIDRAFTIDFGKFFPNDYDCFFDQKSQAKKLGFPVISHIKETDMAAAPADSDGKKSISFLKELNGLLSQTPFELAYRSLNELLLAVVCFRPEDDVQLQAVWDDFLMTKVLPRIEGDVEKLSAKRDGGEGADLLKQLENKLKTLLPAIWDGVRPDLLRINVDGQPLVVPARSKEKLDWMWGRLDKNSFTAFWP
jgi:hypothetical protein